MLNCGRRARLRLRWAITFPPFLAALALGLQQPGAQRIAFVDVTVIPMDSDRVLPHRTVLIDRGTIQWIRPADSAALPSSVVRIDGRGRYLLPGLVDLHVHLSRGREELPRYLYWGVTTVLDLASRSDDQDSLLALRAALGTAHMLGPNLYLAGSSVDGEPPVNARFSEVVQTAADARRLVEERERRGYDVIKVYNNVSRDAHQALIDAARQRGLSVVGHIPRSIGAEQSIAAGQVMIAHGEEFFFTYFAGPRSTRNMDTTWRADTARIAPLIDLLRRHGTWVMPNLSFIEMTRRQIRAFDSLMNDAEVQRLPTSVLTTWRNSDPRRRSDLAAFAWRDSVKYELVRLITRRMHEANIPLLLGTDAVAPGMLPGSAAHLELELLVRAGLTPYEALVTATRGAGDFAARHLRARERFGAVRAGYRADLLVLDGDPQADIANARRIVGVMRRGVWHTREQLAANSAR